MKFPFVPRSLHDEAVAQLRADLADERLRTKRLTRVIVKMKVAGGSIPRPAPLTLTPRDDDPIDRAIDEHKYANRPAVRARMRKFADDELRRGVLSKAQIETKIRTWANLTRDDDDDDDDVIALGSGS